MTKHQKQMTKKTKEEEEKKDVNSVALLQKCLYQVKDVSVPLLGACS